MSLPVPNLDDRKFAALVEQARVRIPRYTPEWTDHNVHDPGITLLELFAWLAEMQIYYLNRVPAKHELKFLRSLGFKPLPALPAKAWITFTALSSEIYEFIPQGTQVATPKSGGNEPIVFETDISLHVLPITLSQVISSDQFGICETTQANEQEEAYYLAFGENAEEGSTLYLGLEYFASPPAEQFSASPPEAIQLTLFVSLYEQDLPPRGTHDDEQIATANGLTLLQEYDNKVKFFPSATVEWDYWNGAEWINYLPDGDSFLYRDDTCGFFWSGNIIFNLPSDLRRRKIPPFGQELFWFRCRVAQPGYEIPPRIESIRLHTIPVTQGVTVMDEILGSSNQLPNQIFKFSYAPILARTQKIEIKEPDGKWKEWYEVSDFDASGPDDEHYVINPLIAEVRFGDGNHGRIPPSGTENIKAVRYRYGGGIVGNVAAEKIQIIMDDIYSSIEITNKQAATGGSEAEKLSETQRRLLLDLRTPYQAVTLSDYEFLAMATPGLRVARAKALLPVNLSEDQNCGCAVKVVVVPFNFSPRPMPSDGFRRTVCEHLDCHRLITTSVCVIPPDYVQVAVQAIVMLKAGFSASSARMEIEKALNDFLHPLLGGSTKTGWEFGRSVYQSEIYQVIEGVNGVDCVMQVVLAAQGSFQFDGNNIKLTQPNGLVYAGEHRLELIEPERRCEVKGPCHEVYK